MTEGKQWAATYFDGRSAQRHKVGVSIAATGLRIHRQDGPTVWWPYEQIEQTQGFNRGEHVRLERGGELGEALVIPEPGFLASVRALAPDAKLKGPHRRSVGFLIAAASGVGAVAAAAGMYVWGIPALANTAAMTVPVSWEEALGKAVSEKMAPLSERCSDQASIQALERMVAKLTAGQPQPYTFRVAISKSEEVNAFAAPGGYIVVNRGLLVKTKRPEELAGVLAHEIQHVLKRHSTRAIFKQTSLNLVLSALVGDATAIKEILGAAGTLGSLAYQRSDEEEADREGMKLMLAAGIDPGGMVDMFRILQKEEGESLGEFDKALSYVSTHPATSDRIAKLSAQAKGATGRPVALDLGVPWRRVQGGCE